jgi:hypothetical protein
MSNSPYWRRAVLGGLAFVVASLVGVWGSRAQDPVPEAPPVPVGDVHVAITGAGIPVRHVQFVGGRYELVFAENCSDADRAAAYEISARVAGSPRTTVAVDNIADALVVLRFEPHNPAALAVVRERYFQLKAEIR